MPTEIAFIGDKSITVKEPSADLVAKLGHPGAVQVTVLLANGGYRTQQVCLMHAYTLVDR